MAMDSSTNIHRVETITIVRRDLPSVSLIELRLAGPDGEHITNAFGRPGAPAVIDETADRAAMVDLLTDIEGFLYGWTDPQAVDLQARVGAALDRLGVPQIKGRVA